MIQIEEIKAKAKTYSRKEIKEGLAELGPHIGLSLKELMRKAIELAWTEGYQERLKDEREGR